MSPTVLLILALSGSLNVDGTMANDTWANPLESLRRTLRYWRDIYRTYQEEFELGYCWADYILGFEDTAFRAESESMRQSPPKTYANIMHDESTAFNKEDVLANSANNSKVRTNFRGVTSPDEPSDQSTGMFIDATIAQSAITVPLNSSRTKRFSDIGNNKQKGNTAKKYVNENGNLSTTIDLEFAPNGKILFHEKQSPSFNLNSYANRSERMAGIFVRGEKRFTMPLSNGVRAGTRRMENALKGKGENATHACGIKKCNEKEATEEKSLLPKKASWLVNVSFSPEEDRKLKGPRSMTEAEEVEDNVARKRHIDSRVQTVYGEDLSAFEIPSTVRQESPYRHRSSHYDGPQSREPLESLDLADNTPRGRHFDRNAFPSATNLTDRRHTLRRRGERPSGKNVLQMLKDTSTTHGRILAENYERFPQSNDDKKHSVTRDERYSNTNLPNSKDYDNQSWNTSPNLNLSESEFLNRIFSRNKKIPAMKKNYANNGSNYNEECNKIESLFAARIIPRRGRWALRDHRGQQEAYRRGSLPVGKSLKKGESMGLGESHRPRRSTSLAHFGDERFMGDYTSEAVGWTMENSRRGTSSSMSVDQGRPFNETVLQARRLFETITPMIGLHPTFLGILRLLGMLISLGRRIMDAIETNKVLSCTWDYFSLRISMWIDSP